MGEMPFLGDFEGSAARLWVCRTIAKRLAIDDVSDELFLNQKTFISIFMLSIWDQLR